MNQKIVDFHDYIIGDVLIDLPNITSKRMFGGYGIYQDGYIFAIITSDSDLYFKVDESNQADYEALQSEPFVYEGHKTRKPVMMPYWRLLDEILEDRSVITEWVEKSVEVSVRSKRQF